MTRETLSDDISKATKSLLEMARGVSWNKISDNCLFVISEIKNSTDSQLVQRRRRKSENFKKRLIGLKDAIAELKDKYFELYDINLYIDKALKGVAIIDIRYYSKNSLDIDY
jgi:predicted NACHT family NTPase